MQVDYLIIGQGLAGSALAVSLIRYGQRVLVVDNQLPGTSSRVAAGIFNPITGNKMVKTWKADQLFPFLHQYYRELEQLTGARFFYPLPIYRPFDSIEKQNNWLADSSDPAFLPYLNPNCNPQQYDELVYNEFGGIEVRQSGYLDIVPMLAACKQYLEQQNAFISDTFEESELLLEENGLRWREHSAKKVIFCRGWADGQSRFFNWLPYRPVKGEVLTVALPNHRLTAALNRGCWILPLATEAQLCKVGATYHWHELNNTPTEAAKEELLGKLKQLIRIPYTVTGQVAGVRPATSDRRPFIGIHPRHPQVGIFNGFGTKGVSLTPYFADQFCQHLLHGQALEWGANIIRFLEKKTVTLEDVQDF